MIPITVPYRDVVLRQSTAIVYFLGFHDIALLFWAFSTSSRYVSATIFVTAVTIS